MNWLINGISSLGVVVDFFLVFFFGFVLVMGCGCGLGVVFCIGVFIIRMGWVLLFIMLDIMFNCLFWRFFIVELIRLI